MRLIPSRFSSLFLPQRLPWRSIPLPDNMDGSVSADVTIPILHILIKCLVYIANVRTRHIILKYTSRWQDPLRCGIFLTPLLSWLQRCTLSFDGRASRPETVRYTRPYSTSDSPPHPVGLLFTIGSTSDLGFDILACGACILFPRSDSDPFCFGANWQLPVRLAFFMVSNNVVILYVFGRLSFTFDLPTMPIHAALSVLWQQNSYFLWALRPSVSLGYCLLFGLSLPRGGQSRPSLGSWYRFGLGIRTCRLVRHRPSIQVSFTTVQYSHFINSIRSFRAYIDGWVRRLKQHPPPH